MEQLFYVGHTWVAVFLAFISIVYFAVLNTITGVFCHSAIESAKKDTDLSQLTLERQKKQFETQMTKLFGDIDKDGSGMITLDELEGCLGDLHFRNSFTRLGIEIFDVWRLFTLLDNDGSGSIEIEEFINGCSQLAGHSTAFQLSHLAYEHAKICRLLDHFCPFVERRLDHLMQNDSKMIKRVKTMSGKNMGKENSRRASSRISSSASAASYASEDGSDSGTPKLMAMRFGLHPSPVPPAYEDAKCPTDDAIRL
jgi:hypothetical protein